MKSIKIKTKPKKEKVIKILEKRSQEEKEVSSREIERKNPFETLYELLRTDPQEGWYRATKNYMYLRRVVVSETESLVPQSDDERTLS